MVKADEEEETVGRIFYIINPAGRGGAGIKAWKAFRELWPDAVDQDDVRFTERPGHAREIAAGAGDCDVLAVVGGDGTVGEVISAVMDREGAKPRVATIPAGTGNDIARHMGVHTVAEAVRALRKGHARSVDLIRIDARVDNRPAHIYAFLLANVGFSAIPGVSPWMKRLLGPTGAYYLGTLVQVFAYRCPRMTVRADGREHSGPIWMVTIGNAPSSSGGSMCLSPGAEFDDGELNITIINFSGTSKSGLITRLMPKIAGGTHVKEPDVDYFPAKRIEIESDPPAIVDMDGDLFGTTPATFTVCPNAIRILTPETGKGAPLRGPCP